MLSDTNVKIKKNVTKRKYDKRKCMEGRRRTKSKLYREKCKRRKKENGDKKGAIIKQIRRRKKFRGKDTKDEGKKG